MTGQTEAQTPVIDLSGEGGTGFGEWILVAAVVAAALIYLGRKFVGRRKSGCAGCGKSDCAVHPERRT